MSAIGVSVKFNGDAVVQRDSKRSGRVRAGATDIAEGGNIKRTYGQLSFSELVQGKPHTGPLTIYPPYGVIVNRIKHWDS